MAEPEQEHNVVEFQTMDFGLSCYLAASGHRLIRLQGAVRGHHVFVFSDVKTDTVRGFYGDAMVGARQILAAVRELKAKIRSADLAAGEQVGT